MQKHQYSTKQSRDAERPLLQEAARSSPKHTISTDSLQCFSQALSHTQEFIQLKTRPRATTRADLHLARSNSPIPSRTSGMSSQRWGRSPHLGSKVLGSCQHSSTQARWRAPKRGLPLWNSCLSQGSQHLSDYPYFQTHLVMTLSMTHC